MRTLSDTELVSVTVALGHAQGIEIERRGGFAPVEMGTYPYAPGHYRVLMKALEVYLDLPVETVTPIQAYCLEDGRSLQVILGSWVVATRGYDDYRQGAWTIALKEEVVWPDIGAHYGLEDWPEAPPELFDPAIAVFVCLADLLPEDHYSGRAYRRVCDVLTV